VSELNLCRTTCGCPFSWISPRARHKVSWDGATELLIMVQPFLGNRESWSRAINQVGA